MIERLDAGEAFGDLAAEFSTDPGSADSGGELGCRSPTAYVLQFADALMALEENEVSAPVESSFGFHIIVRTPDTPGMIEPVVIEAQNQLINEWIVETFETAVVELDPAVGVWNGTGIVPANFVTP